MDIHFCDLCNESVPQSDLDIGHAFIRRGRVVCARCERAMTHGQGSGSHGSAGAGGVAVETEVSTAVRSTTADADTEGSDRVMRARSLLADDDSGFGAESSTSPADQAGVTPGAPAATTVPAPVPGRASGLVLAMVALIFTAGAVAVLNEQIGGIADRAHALEAQHRIEESARLALEQENAATRAALAGVESRIAEGFESQRQVAEKSLSDLRAENERLKKAGIELGNRLEEVRAAANQRNQELDRRGDEISHRLAKSEDDGRTLVERLAKMEEQAQRPAAPAVAPVATAESRWGSLVADLQSPKAATRWEAVDQIGQAADPEAVPHLLPMLKDTDVFVRMATARVLGDLKAVTAVPALIDALEDVEPAVREAALGSLRGLTGKDLRFDPMAGEGDRAKKVKAWRDWWKKTEEEGGLGREQG